MIEAIKGFLNLTIGEFILIFSVGFVFFFIVFSIIAVIYLFIMDMIEYIKKKAGNQNF